VRLAIGDIAVAGFVALGVNRSRRIVVVRPRGYFAGLIIANDVQVAASQETDSGLSGHMGGEISSVYSTFQDG